MLVPQFTVRRLLALTAACGVFSVVLRLAYYGHKWAVAVSVMLGSLLAAFAIYALLFELTKALAWLLGGLQPKEKPGSPFAQDTPPPRYVRSSDPE